ncbi:MAG: 2-amino-4-hydroxy-6-hydroxymethyldihydropteridine diphosphokinase, partial [Tepidisphaeraceae bacterium]
MGKAVYPPVTAYIGLGANLGDRRRNIHAAVLKLRDTDGVTVTRVSDLMENPAVGGPEGSPAFLNGVMEARVSSTPQTFLRRLLHIEKELGRLRRRKWEPRVIDLDLLLWGDQIISTENLVVPHPLMHERVFVLQPLAEIAPGAVHPVLQMTVGGLLEDLVKKG